jgi:hypothetical protein
VQQRIQYSAALEPLVQMIEDTPPTEILERTMEKLRGGVSMTTMLTASALAVTRSSDLPPGHHGGPLHPVAGLHAINGLSHRLEGEQRFLPILQHVALSNKHIHHPEMGPYTLLDFKPLDAGGVEATKAAFLHSCTRGESNKADHFFLWLWENIPHIEAFDLLMSVAIPKNVLDDHYFIYPAFTWRALEAIGREHTAVLMRPAVRYVARFPKAPSSPEIERLIEEYDLLNKVTRQTTGDDETAAIGALGEAIRATEDFGSIPVMFAKALADGLSLDGTAEAMSIGAAGLFMRSLTGNPMDVHLHTSANLRRYLVGLEGLSLQNKILSILFWHTGPEVKSTQRRMEPPPQPNPETIAALPWMSEDDLLAAVCQSIFDQPPTDWSKVTNLGLMRAVPEVKITINLATQYMGLGYSAEKLMKRLGTIVCRDNFTEMHAYKHHQAIVEEYAATRAPWRDLHVIAGAQAAAISHGKSMENYTGAMDLLHD